VEQQDRVQTPEEQEQEATETLRKFRNLVQSEGWAELRRIGEAQAAQRIREISGPTTMENIGEHNFSKGEANGIRTLLVLPNSVIEGAELTLKQLENRNATE